MAKDLPIACILQIRISWTFFKCIFHNLNSSVRGTQILRLLSNYHVPGTELSRLRGWQIWMGFGAACISPWTLLYHRTCPAIMIEMRRMLLLLFHSNLCGGHGSLCTGTHLRHTHACSDCSLSLRLLPNPNFLKHFLFYFKEIRSREK